MKTKEVVILVLAIGLVSLLLYCIGLYEQNKDLTEVIAKYTQSVSHEEQVAELHEEFADSVTPYDIGDTCTADRGNSYFFIKQRYMKSTGTWHYDVVYPTETTPIIFKGLMHPLIDGCNYGTDD